MLTYSRQDPTDQTPAGYDIHRRTGDHLQTPQSPFGPSTTTVVTGENGSAIPVPCQWSNSRTVLLVAQSTNREALISTSQIVLPHGRQLQV